ncbi:hypothetical protein SAMN05444280_10180 [Tangfeifania diversioriginum]|uniref:PIN domain-containing protein n=1 Tax=Tangfeifania diversioriginum TaxID=1168035 RepID=A0A1M6A5T7_9BACT|nr:hypothetical protein [Tangfeifania diversioriginum]SHI31841.1 hypothetical protein SAMN05444280_10180 [Tangfeifania diversioriginum]
MRKRIYVDTSVIGGCFDKEFKIWSNQLFDEFIKGEKVAVISDTTLRELELAPDNVKSKIEEVPESNIEYLLTEIEAETLAELYINERAITRRFYEDALHIANATLQNVHVLASWNFKHIVNLDRIKKYNGVNLKHGYTLLEIRTPREILKPEENEE